MTKEKPGLQSGNVAVLGDIAAALVASDPLDQAGRVLARLLAHSGASGGAILVPGTDTPRVLVARNVALPNLESLPSLWQRNERGLRSGTLPVPLIAGFGRAAELCRAEMAAEGARLRTMRDRLQDAILSEVDEAFLNGHRERRLPHNLNISFAYVEGESVLMGLNKETALSSGSACTSSTLEPSYVIAALGASAELAHSSIRFSLHRFTTDEEVDYVVACIDFNGIINLRKEMLRQGMEAAMLLPNAYEHETIAEKLLPRFEATCFASER